MDNYNQSLNYEEQRGENKMPGYMPSENVQTAPQNFVAPTKGGDFPSGQTTIEHTYENGSKVVFVLLSTGKVARIREGKGSDVEAATMESDGDRSKFMSAMMAATVSIDGKAVNMFELAENKMKDYLSIQTAFSSLNF